MGTPYETSLIDPIPATPGDPRTIVVGAPPRGVVRRIRVTGIGGSPSGAVSYALYSSALAFVPAAPGVPGGTLSATSELYRIMPDATVPQGTAIDPAGFDLRHSYQNQDGSPTTRSSRIYLHVVGYGSLAVGVSLVVDTPSLR